MNQNTILLLEYNRETIKQQFSKFLEKNKDEIIEHFGSIDSFLEMLEEADPKGGSENVVTVLLWLKNGLLTFPEVKNGIDVQYQDRTIHLSISDIFKYYTKVKNKKMLPKKYHDIRFITDWLRFIEFLIELVNLMSNIEQQEEANKKGEGKIIFTGKNKTRFYESYNKDHACYIGKGTLWCTAATKSRNYFEEFSADGFRIITMIPANPKHDGREKYQFNLYSFLEGGFADVKFFPGINVFNYLNKALRASELDENLYTDLIDFLFQEFHEELAIKRDTEYPEFFIKNTLNLNELLDFIYNGISFEINYIFNLVHYFHESKGYFTSFQDITKEVLHDIFRKQSTINTVETTIPTSNEFSTMFAFLELFGILEDLYDEFKDSYVESVTVGKNNVRGTVINLIKYAAKINNPMMLLTVIETALDEELEENDTVTIKIQK